jgi:hypothetical protein
VLVPVPVVVVPPGVLVNVQVSVAGRPLNATLPVAKAQVGWVIVPGTGGDRVSHEVVKVSSFPYSVPSVFVAYART